MRCAEIRDELILWFGQKEMPQPLQEHLDACPDCRSFWEELVDLQKTLNREEGFKLSNEETERLLTGVENSLPDRSRRTISVLPVLRIAAAIVIVFGGGFAAYKIGFPGFGNEEAEYAAVDTARSVENIFDESISKTTMVEMLFDETGSQNIEGYGTSSIDDLTDEDLDYLEKNFDVGDLL